MFNLPHEFNQNDFDDFIHNSLKTSNIRFTNSNLLLDGNGRPRGFGFITFDSTQDAIDAKKCLESIDEVKDRRLRIDFSKRR